MAGVEVKKQHYPMSRVHCGAKTRTGGSCCQPAMVNGRCRLHGGKSLSGVQHGRYKHGFYTQEFKEIRAEFRQDMKYMKELMLM